MSSLNVSIVDDEPLWLDLLRLALDSTGLTVQATFTDPHEALANWVDVDVAVLDVELESDIHGFELARRLRSRHPRLSITMLTSVADPWIIDETAASVVERTSYLLKGGVSDVAQLHRVVMAASRGHVVLDPAIVSALRDNGPILGLTPLQGRLLRLMSHGATNSQIARELSISVKTVEANITRIARTLGVGADENVRVGCVTRYIAAAIPGPRRAAHT